MSSANDGGDLGTEPRNGSPGRVALTEPASVPTLPHARLAVGEGADAKPPGSGDAHHHHVIGWRQAVAGLLAGAATLATAGPASIVAIITVWIFAIFPGLRPWEPPAEQKLTVSNAVVAERNHTMADREERTAIYFDIEAIGYDRQPVLVATLWLDAITGERIEPEFVPHGVLESNTRTNRWVHWLNVEYPDLPADSTGCLVLRVLLFLMPEGEPVSAANLASDALNQRAPLLAYADTEAFDPYAVGKGACAAQGETS